MYPLSSPIVRVAKKDGSMQFCVDYCKLNAITMLNVYPLPQIDDSLDLLANTKYFTSLNLASGYWQVGMEQTSQEKLAVLVIRQRLSPVRSPSQIKGMQALVHSSVGTSVVRRLFHSHATQMAHLCASVSIGVGPQIRNLTKIACCMK